MHVDNQGRILHLEGDFTEETTQEFAVMWGELMAEPDPVRLVVDSQGGSVLAMFAITDMLEARPPEVRLETVGRGVLFSAALLPFMVGDRRLVYQDTIAMAHSITTQFEGDLVALTKHRDYIQWRCQRWAQLMAKQTGRSWVTCRGEGQPSWLSVAEGHAGDLYWRGGDALVEACLAHQVITELTPTSHHYGWEGELPVGAENMALPI
jgi:ATP-dependent protease ClpP protease subunit